MCPTSQLSKMFVILLVCSFINLIVIPQSVLGARSTDELDGGYVVREEISHVMYHQSHYNNYSTNNYPMSLKSDQNQGKVTADSIKFWGCYADWTGNPLLGGCNNIHVDNFHPVVCMSACQNEHNAKNYSLALIKGVQCTCVNWNVFDKIRIHDHYCDLNCTANNGVEGKEKNFTCGGNLAQSVYCMGKEGKCFSDNDDPKEFLDGAQVHGIVSSHDGDEEDDGYYQSYLIEECALCISNSSKYYTHNCVGGVINPREDYFPLNSPKACIRNCQRNMNGTVDPLPYALLTWITYHEPISYILPICMCYPHNPFQYISSTDPYMTPVNKINCPTPCPADDHSPCGNIQSSDYSTVYCAMSELNACQPESDSPASSQSTQNMTESTQASSTSTTTSTTITTTTISSTTTKTTTTTTTTLSPLLPHCDEWDMYGVHWNSPAGVLAKKNCSDTTYFQNKDGIAKWQCLGNSSFEYPLPDYTDCKTEWHQDIWKIVNETIEKNGTLPMTTSKEMLNEMEKKSRVSETNKIPYYGHEIKDLSYLTWHIVNNTRATLVEREDLIKQAMKMPALILENPTPWKDMPMVNKKETATNLLHQVEQTLFLLTKNINSSMDPHYNFMYHPEELPKEEFFVTFGVRDKLDKSALTFPLNATSETSSIRLSEGWQQVVREPIFVGKLVASKHVKEILPVTEISFIKKGKPSDETIINGALMSLTILQEPDQPTLNLHDLKGKTVRITFQHEVEAWGKNRENIPRKLHPGETAKAALDTAVCVFWSEDKKQWGKNGCSVIETTKTYTVCECKHLTSFALLMDLHNYVGKDRALELLTLLLCPLSTICLFISIVIFSTVGSIQSQRTTITKHLCICLMFGNILLLFLVDKNYLKLPQEVCIGVGIVTHYVFLAAFVWMAIEGIVLYKMVVHVFDSGRTNTTIYRIIGYGIPLLIVGITCVVGYLMGDEPYGGELFCWLEGNYIWGFVFPIALIIMGNMIILFVALKTAYQMKTATAVVQARQRSYKTWIRGSFSITIILGVTWLPGFFVTIGSSVATVAGYIFVILNASQGIFLFIFHCFMNEKVRSAAERNLSLPSWLSLPGSLSKEFTQSGKRSENMRAYYSEASKQSKSIQENPHSRNNSAKPKTETLGKKFSNDSSGGFDYPTLPLKKLDSGLSTSSRKSFVPRGGDKW